MVDYSKSFKKKMERIRENRISREKYEQRNREQQAKRAEINKSRDETLNELDSSSVWTDEGLREYEEQAARRAQAVQLNGRAALMAALLIGGL